MFKNIISPIQTWLLSQGKCVACGKPLANGKRKKRKDASYQITCSCNRIFIEDPKTKKYRRALEKEVE